MNKNEYVPAEILAKGDNIYYNNEWVTVLSVWCHPNSCYNKINISQKNSPIPLHVRLDKSLSVERKTRNYMEYPHLQNAVELTVVVKAKLEQYAKIINAAVDFEGKVSLGTSIRLDKDTLVKAAREELKAAGNKLNEMMKKL